MAARSEGSFGTSVWHVVVLIVIGCYRATPLLLNDDVLGLIVFKADLQDPKSSLRSWNEDDNSPCNWTGIICSPLNGRVIEVNLEGLSLSGRFGRGLAKLEYLKTLSLANNNFSGSIDEEFAPLNGLRKVNLSHNVLSGQIPPLGNMSSLRFLDLSSNLLSGDIPAELFANCRDLRYISLARNLLQGSIPTSLSSCARLLGFNFSGNLLNGEMPTGMGALLSLQTVDVSHNSISGAFPLVMGSLQNLVDLRLQSNKLSGMILKDIASCTYLVTLDLSSNLLSGRLPEDLQGLQSLSILNLKGNFLSGNIPPWIGNLSTLKTLNLANNFFTGTVPLTVGFLKMLQVLDFSTNGLTGPIPSTLSSCAQLSSVDLSRNNFSGTIPQDLFALDLVLLRLSNNGFTGTIPTGSLSYCGFIRVLDLSQNQLNGSLPSQIGNCANLKYVNMSVNSFSEGIPCIGQLHSLQVFDLSNNQLTGSIPSGIGDATLLSTLLLNHNSLNGPIPHNLGNCSALTNLGLSHNNLNGSIPPDLGKLNELELLDLSFNNLSGGIPSELGSLQSLAVVNVSYNQLEGPVPIDGIFSRINETSFLGNDGLCGAAVNATCPCVLPKPIVLNPNSSGGNSSVTNPLLNSHRRIVLSPSAIIAITAAALIALGVVIITFLNIREHTRPLSSPHRSGSLSQSPSTDLSMGKLVMFTKSSDPRSEEWVTSAHALLDKDSELGRGGIGTVYKAVLGDGRTVAIKKLMVSSLVKSQEEFEKEVQLLGNIKHRSLVGLQGYYWTPQLQLLIYDFVPSGNLYSRLHEKSQGDASLSWSKRFEIALGVAQGMAHLHHACDPPVIHYNMKSSNVLLDESHNPKIADYGLAKLLSMLDRYIMSSKFQSALGYMAPEFACQSLKINEKCDVYGYGIMLLELVTGRRPVEYMEDDVVILCDYVRSLLDEGKAMNCVDTTLQYCVEDEVLPVIKLGLICTSQVPSNRPSMAEVVEILELIKTECSCKDLP